MNEERVEQLEVVRGRGARMAKGAIIFLAFVISFSLAASGYALYYRFVDTDARRALLEAQAQQQALFNQRVRDVSFGYCTEIELLKKANRDRAVEDYRRLDQTLELLKLERTPAIVERAKKDRDTALRRFAPNSCPRPGIVPVHPLPKG